MFALSNIKNCPGRKILARLISTGLQPGGSRRNERPAASAAFASCPKPLKRLWSLLSDPATGLKPGVNERLTRQNEISRVNLMSVGNSARREAGKTQHFSNDSIPKGLHHSAQGCRVCEATLGYGSEMSFNPERVASNPGGDDATPLGLVNISTRSPRVARSSQPLAERLNPVGILISNFRKAFGSTLPLLALMAMLGYLPTANARSDPWTLKSPEGNCEIRVTLDGGMMTYQALRAGKVVLPTSPLGLRRDDQDFSHELIFDHAGKPKTQREQYELFAGPQPRVNHLVNFRTLTFHNANGAPLALDLAASDEGVAFRYRFPETNNAVRIVDAELSGFALPQNSRGWLQPYHAAGPYTPAYEDFYFHVGVGELPPDSRQKARGWAFPALFDVPDAKTWVLLTESGTDEAYCACHLAPDSPDGIYRIAFPLADETTRGYTNKFGPEPQFTLPWTMPWRVIVLSDDAGRIATETLVTDLAPPSRIADTSWIKPGRASWAWWSYPDEPATAKRFDEFTDFAAKMGWEYTLFDAGWWVPGLKPIAQHALAEGVTPLAWSFASDFYEAKSRNHKLDEIAGGGARGVKVDFWCSDRQEAIAAQQALMRDAAARHMVVNLHGCTIPRGWQRTWPNFLTCEAVLGCESYFYEPRYTEKAAELDTVLPFTRNAVGPMDLTPVACSPKKYVRTTTAAHQLAAALIFTSGIVHYADQPEFFESLPPDVLKIFRDAPARWDETRCLIGEPGTLAVFARRSGRSWFIAGTSGSVQPQTVTLDLAPFKKYTKRLAVTEGENAIMQVTASPLEKAAVWKHEMPPRGGFILRLDE